MKRTIFTLIAAAALAVLAGCSDGMSLDSTAKTESSTGQNTSLDKSTSVKSSTERALKIEVPLPPLIYRAAKEILADELKLKQSAVVGLSEKVFAAVDVGYGFSPELLQQMSKMAGQEITERQATLLAIALITSPVHAAGSCYRYLSITNAVYFGNGVMTETVANAGKTFDNPVKFRAAFKTTFDGLNYAAILNDVRKSFVGKVDCWFAEAFDHRFTQPGFATFSHTSSGWTIDQDGVKWLGDGKISGNGYTVSLGSTVSTEIGSTGSSKVDVGAGTNVGSGSTAHRK